MANSLTDILSVLQNGVQAIQTIYKALNTVATTNSSLATITIRLTQVSS